MNMLPKAIYLCCEFPMSIFTEIKRQTSKLKWKYKGIWTTREILGKKNMNSHTQSETGKNKTSQAVAAHAFNPSTCEAMPDGSLSLT